MFEERNRFTFPAPAERNVCSSEIALRSPLQGSGMSVVAKSLYVPRSRGSGMFVVANRFTLPAPGGAECLKSEIALRSPLQRSEMFVVAKSLYVPRSRGAECL